MVGGGFMARTHSHAARVAGAKLSCLASSNLDSAHRAATSLGYEDAATTDELFSRGLPIVHVCSPNEQHVAHSLAALRAGSFVICEKPLATSAAVARELTEEAAAAGMPGAVPFVYRYHPMVREARARVRAGHAGDILTLNGVYLQDWLLAATDDNWRVNARTGGPSRALPTLDRILLTS